MLIESAYDFTTAYITGTFDARVELFQLTPQQSYIGVWNAQVAYLTSQAVTGSDGNIYVAVAQSTGVNPTTDNGSHWTLASPYVLTNYRVQMVIADAFTLSSDPGGGASVYGASGTVVFHGTPSQTAAVTPGQHPYMLQLTASPVGGLPPDVYFGMAGHVTFASPMASS